MDSTIPVVREIHGWFKDYRPVSIVSASDHGSMQEPLDTLTCPVLDSRQEAIMCSRCEQEYRRTEYYEYSGYGDETLHNRRMKAVRKRLEEGCAVDVHGSDVWDADL